MGLLPTEFWVSWQSLCLVYWCSMWCLALRTCQTHVEEWNDSCRNSGPIQSDLLRRLDIAHYLSVSTVNTVSPSDHSFSLRLCLQLGWTATGRWGLPRHMGRKIPSRDMGASGSHTWCVNYVRIHLSPHAAFKLWFRFLCKCQNGVNVPAGLEDMSNCSPRQLRFSGQIKEWAKFC